MSTSQLPSRPHPRLHEPPLSAPSPKEIWDPTFKIATEVAPLARVEKGEAGWGRDARPHLLSALSPGQVVWMGCFQLQVHPAAARTAKLFGQIRGQGVNGGGPRVGLRGAQRGRRERVQRARAAGPTLTGTLETCVLGGSQPLAQSRKGMQGGQEPDHLLPPHPGPLVLGDPCPLPSPRIPGTSLPS